MAALLAGRVRFIPEADMHFLMRRRQAAALYPRGGYALFNAPSSGAGNFVQYVINLETGAWSRFTNQNAYTWAVFNSDIYFGGNTKVLKADTGLADDGETIDATAKTAFIYFGERRGPTRYTAIRPVMASENALVVSIGFDVDYRDGTATLTPTTGTSEGATWDVAPWDTSSWGAPINTKLEWLSVAEIGWNAAIRIKTSTDKQSVRWLATDVRYEPGQGGF